MGTSAGEVIHGTPGNDVIVARGGNDVVYAGAGNDIVCGNGGADRLYGGFGWDDLNGDHGHDQLYGGNGRDRLAGGTGADRLWGHDGDDRLLGGDHDDMILSGLGNDTAFGGGDDDTVAGGPGDDLLRGDAGNDIVTGGFGNDRIYGGVGADDLDGGGDDDVLFSGPDDVSVEGGPGNDVCAVGCEEDDSSVDPIAVDDVATTDEDTPVTIDVLSNDIDPDSDLTVASVSDTALGATVEIAADGGVRYTPPADVSGTDTFSYNVTDGFDSDTATVTVTIDAVNDAPNALDDTVSTVEDQSVEIGVLANDVDVDSNLTVTGVSDVSDGAEVEIGEDSRLRYTPPADWNGTDTFTYTMSDGELTDTATVTVNVAAANDSPMAQDDTATTDEDQSIAIDVIANDTDTDNAELALTGVSESTALGGTVVRGETPNTVLYTPPADTSGTDTFTYTVTDGEEIDTGMVTVTINPVNDPPVAEDDGFVTEEDTPVQLDPLDNDRDIDSEIFLLSADAETEFGGTLEVTKGGAVDYTPPENEFGTDSFSYTVSDGEFEDTATVNIQIFEVNDAPEARDDTANTDEDTAVDIDVFGNDSDVESPVSDLRITAVSETERGGRVETQEVGVLRYEPPSNVNGEDSFTYTVTDGEDTATARVTVLIAAIDDPPIAGDDEAATDEDVAVEIDVLANDTEFDGSPLSVSEVRESSLGAEVVVTDSGKLLYTPPANAYGEDLFTYTVSNRFETATGTVRVTIAPVNDAPVAQSDEASTDQEVAIEIDVLANDSDIDGDELVIGRISRSAFGAALGITTDGKIRYTPPAGQFGEDSFTYSVSDGELTHSNVVTVTVNQVTVVRTARLTVDRITWTRGFDGTFSGEFDYEATLELFGDFASGRRTFGPIDNENDIRPNWQVAASSTTNGLVRARLAVSDDEGPFSSSDVVDVSPSSLTYVEVVADPATGLVREGTQVVGNIGRPITLAGNAGSLRARVTFTLDIIRAGGQDSR